MLDVKFFSPFPRPLNWSNETLRDQNSSTPYPFPFVVPSLLLVFLLLTFGPFPSASLFTLSNLARFHASFNNTVLFFSILTQYLTTNKHHCYRNLAAAQRKGACPWCTWLIAEFQNGDAAHVERCNVSHVSHHQDSKRKSPLSISPLRRKWRWTEMTSRNNCDVFRLCAVYPSPAQIVESITSDDTPSINIRTCIFFTIISSVIAGCECVIEHHYHVRTSNSPNEEVP
jgi:hypothetical protein